jgi:predicted nucleic acid-binding protein
LKAFVDTSALAKRYIEEPGSEALEDLFFNTVTDVFVSTLALPEFASAISRKLRTKEIRKRPAIKALGEFEKDWHGLFVKIPLTEAVAESAESMVIDYVLKGGDGVHLASALMVGVDLFVASDNQLIRAAKSIDLKTYDPVTGPFQYRS